MISFLKILCFIPFIPVILLAQPTAIPFQPEQYVCYQSKEPVQLDGKLTEADWAKVPWTKDFTDIQGSLQPEPRFRTRVKMLWDEHYFYVAAELDEPHIWANLTERESVIFQDNDFEVFIDPDGDTHNYYEFEVNALGTEWDLLLMKPYRDGAMAINSWNINGLKVGINIEGTINDAAKEDKKWTIEMAFPWDVLKECAPAKRKPKAGEQWRVNFSRVEWQTEIINGKHRKKINPATAKPFPEDNWVWSPQGVVDMHRPETWGFVQFSEQKAGAGSDNFIINKDEQVKWALRQIYYAQQQWKKQHHNYTQHLSDLNYTKVLIPGYVFDPEMQSTQSLYEVTATSINGKDKWHIRQDGLIWKK